METQLKIETVRHYLQNAFPEHEVHDHPGDLQHVFTIYRDGVSREVTVWRSFLDDRHAADKITGYLDHHRLVEMIRTAGNRLVIVSNLGISYEGR